MVTWQKFPPALLLGALLLVAASANAQDEAKDSSSSSDWGVIERLRGTDDTTVVDEEDAATDQTSSDKESTSKESASEEEGASEEVISEESSEAAADQDEAFADEIDTEPLVETVTKETVEELGRKLVGGDEHTCLRCKKKNQLAVQVLGVKTLVGVTGLTVTRHVMSRTSLQAGIGYGFGGFTLGGAMLHYFRESSSLHLLTGMNISVASNDEERDLEGLWMLLGIGSSFNTQVGISYGVDFGMTMSIIENIFKKSMRLCFGVISQRACEEKWRITPYITPIRIGYTF